MSKVGMLWQFNGKDTNIEKAVIEGLRHFEKEYKVKPLQIELNPEHINVTFKGVKVLDGIPLVEGKQVFKNQAVYSIDETIEELVNRRRIARLMSLG